MSSRAARLLVAAMAPVRRGVPPGVPGGAAAAPPAGPAQRASGPRVARDVVLITIDTLPPTPSGFDGNTRGTTPNLDRFASEGRVFSSAHAHNVITLPSHTNILTGLYPYQHGVRENAGFRLSPKFATVATTPQGERDTRPAPSSARFPLDSRYGLARGFDVYEELYRHTDEQPRTSRSSRRAPTKSCTGGARVVSRPGGPAALPLGSRLRSRTLPTIRRTSSAKRFPDDLYLGEVAFTDAALAPLLEAVRGRRARRRFSS